MSDYLDPDNEELLKDFFIEAELMVEMLEQNILVLESNPDNGDAIDEIFRAAHTLKGAAATVQMTELSGFTHIVEDVLDEIRSGTIKVTGNVVDILLESIDVVKAMLETRSSGEIYSENISDIENRLKVLLDSPEPAKTVVSEPVKKQEVVEQNNAGKGDTSSALSEYELLELKEASVEGEEIYQVQVGFDEDNPMNSVGGIQVFAAIKSLGTVLKTSPDFDELYEDKYFPIVNYYLSTDAEIETIKSKAAINEVTTDISVINLFQLLETSEAAVDGKPENTVPEPPASVENEKKALPEKKAESAGLLQKKSTSEKKNDKKSSVLRVDSRRIDNLLNLVSEAVITKAAFSQISGQFTEAMMDLNDIKNKWNDQLMSLFDSIPEYIENIKSGISSNEVKKDLMGKYESLFSMLDPLEVNLKSTIGKFINTSQILARTISDLQEGVMQIRMVPISQIFSRFPRLVRDVSKSLKKKINLIVEGEDTELDKSVIEDLLDPLIHCVRNSVDHGIENPEDRVAAGKNPEGTVLLKANNEGNVITISISDDGKGIDVNAVHQKAIERGLIHPNKQLSDVEAFSLIFEPGFSTAKAVTNISGRGVGLDVVRRQIDKLNGNVSIWSELGNGSRTTIKLPLTLAIIQGLLVRVGSQIYAIPITSVVDSHRIMPNEIRMIDNYEVFNVREDVISLIRLDKLFKIPSNKNSKYHFVVVVGSGDKKMGLIVDSLIGEEDVVIKPLKDKYTNSPGIAGATILGDGTVSLIIDVGQLLELGLEKEQAIRNKRMAALT